jgi:hypothetical protein
MDDQALFDIIHCTTIGKIRSKTPTSQVIAISTSNAAVSPITVQAQSRTTTAAAAVETQAAHDQHERAATPSPPSSLSDGPSAGKLYVERQQHNASPAAGALTAAMEAANEAQSRKAKKSNASSKSEEDDLDDNSTSNYTNDDRSITEEGPPPATAPVSCDCDDHLEKTEADLELPTSAHALYTILSGTSCWEQLNKEKGNSGK